MNILIAAHYNLNNGDRAVLEATVREINSIFPDSEIIVSAYCPDQIRDERFKTVGWPLRNGIFESICLKLSKYRVCRNLFKRHFRYICPKDYLQAVENADIIFMSGGHHLTDILSSTVFYKLASNFIIPIGFGKKVILLPQSIGPASDPEVIDIIKYILQNAYSVAYRDATSNDFMNSNNIICNKKYVPDLVYALEPKTNTVESSSEERTVGIALYHSYAGERRTTILPYTIKNLKITVNTLIKRGYSIKIIPMDIGDDEIFGEIKESVDSSCRTHIYMGNQSDSIMDVINEFSNLSFALAYKTHSTVFSMICNTPLIAIAYHPKSIEFMDNIGLGEYAIYDKDASSEKIISLVNKLEENSDCIKRIEKAGIDKNRDAIRDYIKGVAQ